MIQWLFLMFMFHFVDDFFLQGMCLSNLKQKKFWQEHAPQELYKYDYLMALFCHCFMWAISIMIPTMITGHFIWWLIPINASIHFVVDDLKANKFKINLITDQTIHFIQIVFTFFVCYHWIVE